MDNLDKMDEMDKSKFRGVGNTKQPRTRVKNWCFTLNNYTLDEIKELETWFDGKGLYVFQEETGDSGTPHLQGFVTFNERIDLSKLVKINRRIHWEVSRNVEASRMYCYKEESRTGDIYSNFDYTVEIGKNGRTDGEKQGSKNKKLLYEDIMRDVWRNNFLLTKSKEFMDDIDKLDLGGGLHASMWGPL